MILQNKTVVSICSIFPNYPDSREALNLVITNLMKYKILSPFIAILLLLALPMEAFTQSKQTKSFRWDSDSKKEHKENRESPGKWSAANLEADMDDIEITGRPMVEGVYPVPDYNLVGKGSYSGNGTIGNYKGILLEDKTVLYNGFYQKKSSINESILGDNSDEVYFVIVCLTDTVDLKGYSHMESSASSRNHPDYIGQGSINTRDNRIDFISFLTADRDNYAIVNLRLFDLNLGRVILIAPQQDGSLRSMQVEAPPLSSEAVEVYITNKLLKESAVYSFFTNDGNI